MNVLYPFFSLYVHIPFCDNLCDFCHFYRVRPRDRELFLGALCSEAHHMAGRAPGPVRSLYVGGGTPGQLTGAAYREIFSALAEAFSMRSVLESTVEAVPDTDIAELEGFAAAGFNRVSIGIKSFDHESLSMLGAVRTGGSPTGSVAAARSAGFQSVGVDLVYAFAGQTMDSFMGDLETTLAMEPDHISLYSLVGKEDDGPGETDEDTAAEMFTESRRTLLAEGYRHYEICNFARPGHESIHNNNYWFDGDFIGLGPGAHSSITTKGTRLRWRNLPDLSAYLVDPTDIYEELAREGPELRAAEALVLALRRSEGVEIDSFLLRYGTDPRQLLGTALGMFVELGLIRTSPRRIRLTPRGMLLSNEVFGSIV